MILFVAIIATMFCYSRQEAGGRRQEAGGESRGEKERRRDSPKGPKSENLIRKEKRIEDRGLTRPDSNLNPDP